MTILMTITSDDDDDDDNFIISFIAYMTFIHFQSKYNVLSDRMFDSTIVYV